MQQTSLTKLVITSIMLIICQIAMSQSQPAPTLYRGQLVFPEITQITDRDLLVTMTLNQLLAPTGVFNIAVFAPGIDVMTHCDAYPAYNGCYFPGITTAAPFSFHLVGNFENGWQNTSGHAFLVTFNIPPPSVASTSGTFLFPALTNFDGIKFPRNSTATMEFYPFIRLAG